MFSLLNLGKGRIVWQSGSKEWKILLELEGEVKHSYAMTLEDAVSEYKRLVNDNINPRYRHQWGLPDAEEDQ